MLARATPEPGGNRNPQKSHSFWTRKERDKICPNLKHIGRERAFLLETHPEKHQSQPPCLIVPKSPCCPQGHAVAGPAGHMGLWVHGRAQHIQPGNGTEGRKKEKHPRSAALWQTPSCPQVSSGRGQSSPLAQRGCSREGSVRRECVNCPRSLLSLPGLWNNQH